MTIGDCRDVSQPKVSVIIKSVTEAISDLAPQYIKFPTPAEEQNKMQEFAQIRAPPGTIGAIDGVCIFYLF